MAKQVLSHQTEGGAVHAFTAEERRAFSTHINDVLKGEPSLAGVVPINPESDDLFRVVGNGVLLCKLLNKVVAGTVPENKINTKANLNQFEVNAMHGLALAGAKNIGCQIVNIGPDDLRAGTPHLILGLVWQIVRIDLMNKVKEGMKNLAAQLAPGDDPNNFLNVAPETNLLHWFNFHLRHAGYPRQITNFGADIRDSEAYVLLFSQVAPQACDRSPLAEQDPLKRAALMLDQAARVNCKKFVTPADVVAGNTKLNLAFTSFIFLTCPGVLDIDAAEAAERRAAEEAARRAAEAEAARRKAEEDARAAAEAARRAEEEARQRAAEEARRAEETRRQAEEEARRQAEEAARRQAEEEARRRAEEAARLKAEEEARRRAEEEARLRAQANAAGAEEARRRAAWDAYNRQTLSQKWFYDDGYICSNAAPTLCLMIEGDQTANGNTRVVLGVKGEPRVQTQKWDVDQYGFICNRANGFALEVAGASPVAGTVVGVNPRNAAEGANNYQKWGWTPDGYLLPQHSPGTVLEAPLPPNGALVPGIPTRTWQRL